MRRYHCHRCDAVVDESEITEVKGTVGFFKHTQCGGFALEFDETDDSKEFIDSLIDDKLKSATKLNIGGVS